MTGIHKDLAEVSGADSPDAKGDAEAAAPDVSAHAQPGQSDAGGQGATIIRFPDSW